MSGTEADFQRALSCLYLEAPGEVAKDVGIKVRRHLEAVEAERDAYRSALCDVVASASPNRKDHPTMHDAWEKARAVLKSGAPPAPSDPQVKP